VNGRRSAHPPDHQDCSLTNNPLLSTGLLDFWQHNAHRATVVTKHTDDALDWRTLVYREHLEWVADQVVEAGGTALLPRARTLARKDDRSLAEAMSHARAEEYRALAERDDTVLSLTGPIFDGLFDYYRRSLLLGRDTSS
jgi:hypothetical protein